MAIERPTIRLTIKVVGSSEAGNAAAFWSSIFASEPYTKLTPDEYEALVVEKLPEALFDALMAYVKRRVRPFEEEQLQQDRYWDEYLFERLARLREREKSPSEPEDDARLRDILSQRARRDAFAGISPGGLERLNAASYVSFHVSVVGYSSITLAVAIGGLPNAIRAFDANFDAFSDFVSAYLPAAFQTTVHHYGVKPVTVTVDDDSELRAAFAAASPGTGATSAPLMQTLSPATAPAPVPAPEFDRHHRYWQIANYSLLVPFVFCVALFVGAAMYLAENMQQLDATRRELMKESLVDRQATLSLTQHLYETRLQQLDTALACQASASSQPAAPSPAKLSAAP